MKTNCITFFYRFLQLQDRFATCFKNMWNRKWVFYLGKSEISLDLKLLPKLKIPNFQGARKICKKKSSKKETCLRGLKAVRPHGWNGYDSLRRRPQAEINFFKEWVNWVWHVIFFVKNVGVSKYFGHVLRLRFVGVIFWSISNVHVRRCEYISANEST